MLGRMRQDLPQTFARGQPEGEPGDVQWGCKCLGRARFKEAHKAIAKVAHLLLNQLKS